MSNLTSALSSNFNKNNSPFEPRGNTKKWNKLSIIGFILSLYFYYILFIPIDISYPSWISQSEYGILVYLIILFAINIISFKQIRMNKERGIYLSIFGIATSALIVVSLILGSILGFWIYIT